MVAGRALHDAVATKAALGLNSIYATWRKLGKLPPFIIAWPLPDLDFKNCLPTDAEVVVELPENQKTWEPIFKRLLETAEPFAVLLAQQKEKEVLLTLESEYGSSSWHIPIKRHGAELVLGQPSTKTDVDAIGLLWKAGAKN